jgi:cardiolipin synthase
MAVVLVESGQRPGPILRSLPNALSFLRLGCAAAFPFVPRSWWLELVVVAGVSDWLDGYIARRFHAESWLGGLLDGISDKAVVVTVLVTLCLRGMLAWWQLPFLLLRDLSVGTGVLVSVLRRDREAFQHMDSRTFGKLTTAAIFVFLVVLLLCPHTTTAHGLLYAASAILSAIAGVDYATARHRRIIRGETA